MRVFDTGATRDGDVGKLDYEGFLSPQALEVFAKYMNFHRHTAVGVRDSDNWQKGFPREVLVKSMWRHFFSLWRWHRSTTDDGCMRAFEHPLEDACGILFNTMAFIKQMADEDPEAVNEMLRTLRHKRDQAAYAKATAGLREPWGVMRPDEETHEWVDHEPDSLGG